MPDYAAQIPAERPLGDRRLRARAAAERVRAARATCRPPIAASSTRTAGGAERAAEPRDSNDMALRRDRRTDLPGARADQRTFLLAGAAGAVAVRVGYCHQPGAVLHART